MSKQNDRNVSIYVLSLISLVIITHFEVNIKKKNICEGKVLKRKIDQKSNEKCKSKIVFSITFTKYYTKSNH